MMLKSTSEMQSQLDEALEAESRASDFPDLTYENGVAEALKWVMGMTEDPPLETM